MTGSDASGPIDMMSSGVADLANSALVEPVVDVLRNVWEGYFGVPIPPGTTNWNAYTHQQMYDMLWQNADVGDVSSVAAEWDRHSTELADHADTLRTQRTALLANWSGQAAEPAATRLGDLGDRTAGISARAGTVAQATQQAGDALSVARNTMPPPPGDPTGVVIAGAAAGAGVGALIGGVLGAGAGGIGAAPGAVMGAAIGAVAGGGASLFLASATAAEEKAQAVHVMQTYEASLLHSSGAIAATPAGATQADPVTGPALATTLSGYAGPLAGGAGEGVPWQQLVGASPLSAAVGPGAGSGVLPVRPGVPPDELADALAGETTAGPDMAPGTGAGLRRRGGDQDTEYHSALPVVDHKLFESDDRAAPRVIGQ